MISELRANARAPTRGGPPTRRRSSHRATESKHQLEIFLIHRCRFHVHRNRASLSARASSSHMRRTSSLEDVRAFVSHFPDHLSWRAERESFAHEATQYALWIPFAALARACGMRTL